MSMNDKIDTINFDAVFQHIGMDWFYTKPILFKLLCLYELKPVSGIDCDFRTNGKIIEYNPERIAEKNMKSVKGSLELELCRILLRHPYRKKPEAHEKEWYKASTITITQKYLSKYNLPTGMNIEFYYAELMKQEIDIENEAQGGAEKSRGDKNTDEENTADGTGEADSVSEETEKDAGETDACGPTAYWGGDEVAARTVEDFVTENLAAQLWGNLPGTVEQQLRAEFTEFPYYKKVLQFFRESAGKGNRMLTRMKPSRRCGFLQMGSRYKALPGKILVALDTSESVSDRELEKFYGAIKSIYLQGIKKIDVIQFDAKLLSEKPEKFSRKAFYKIRGRGGTNYQCVFDYVRKYSYRYDGLIIFTDGCANQPEISMSHQVKVMWMLTSRHGVRQWMKKNALCGWF